MRAIATSRSVRSASEPKRSDCLTGLSIATISAARSGKELPSWDTLLKYLKALGIENPEDWRPRWDMLASADQRRAADIPTNPAHHGPRYTWMLPSSVTNLEEFALALNELRMWRDNRPYKTIIRLAAAAGFPVCKTTISNVLNGKKLPSADILKGILHGLDLGPDVPETAQWLDARRLVQAGIMRQQRQLQHQHEAKINLPRKAMRTRRAPKVPFFWRQPCTSNNREENEK